MNSQNVEQLYEYAAAGFPSWVNEDSFKYNCYADCKVTYNKNHIISIRIRTFWYAGGVSNPDEYGLTYNLKTGKKLYLTNVCNGNSQEIKTTVLKALKKKYGQSMPVYKANFQKLKAKNMSFHLKPNRKAVVSFGPYELGQGGSFVNVTIHSKYK